MFPVKTAVLKLDIELRRYYRRTLAQVMNWQKKIAGLKINIVHYLGKISGMRFICFCFWAIRYNVQKTDLEERGTSFKRWP
jgi:hypothetical protein